MQAGFQSRCLVILMPSSLDAKEACNFQKCLVMRNPQTTGRKSQNPPLPLPCSWLLRKCAGHQDSEPSVPRAVGPFLQGFTNQERGQSTHGDMVTRATLGFHVGAH